MLRHSRAQTYWMNRKHKERDKIHGDSYKGCPCGIDYDLRDMAYKKKHRFNLIEYLRSWGIMY